MIGNNFIQYAENEPSLISFLFFVVKIKVIPIEINKTFPASSLIKIISQKYISKIHNSLKTSFFQISFDFAQVYYTIKFNIPTTHVIKRISGV